MAYDVKDAAGTTITMRSRVDGGEHIPTKDIERSRGAGDYAYGEATIDTTVGGVVIAAARATRRRIVVQLLTGDMDVFIGKSGVTASGAGVGWRMFAAPGRELVLEVTGEVRGIVAAGSTLVGYREEFD